MLRDKMIDHRVENVEIFIRWHSTVSKLYHLPYQRWEPRLLLPWQHDDYVGAEIPDLVFSHWQMKVKVRRTDQGRILAPPVCSGWNIPQGLVLAVVWKACGRGGKVMEDESGEASMVAEMMTLDLVWLLTNVEGVWRILLAPVLMLHLQHILISRPHTRSNQSSNDSGDLVICWGLHEPSASANVSQLIPTHLPSQV